MDNIQLNLEQATFARMRKPGNVGDDVTLHIFINRLWTPKRNPPVRILCQLPTRVRMTKPGNVGHDVTLHIFIHRLQTAKEKPSGTRICANCQRVRA